MHRQTSCTGPHALQGSRSVKADGMPNGHASTRPQSAGSAARADPSPSSVAPPAASPSERTASSNPTAEEDSQSHLQQHLSSTAASSKSKLQHQAPPDSDIMPVPDSHGLNGLPGGADAVAWVKEATGVGSDQRVCSHHKNLFSDAACSWPVPLAGMRYANLVQIPLAADSGRVSQYPYWQVVKGILQE